MLTDLNRYFRNEKWILNPPCLPIPPNTPNNNFIKKLLFGGSYNGNTTACKAVNSGSIPLPN